MLFTVLKDEFVIICKIFKADNIKRVAPYTFTVKQYKDTVNKIKQTTTV